MGVTTGTLAGRDDGWAERKFSAHRNLQEAVAVVAGRDVEYFELVPISAARLAAAREANESANRRHERAEIDRKITGLERRRRELKKR